MASFIPPGISAQLWVPSTWQIPIHNSHTKLQLLGPGSWDLLLLQEENRAETIYISLRPSSLELMPRDFFQPMFKGQGCPHRID